MPRAGSRSAVAVWTILRKECRSEWRTRYGLNAALLFAVASLTAVSFAAGRLTNRTDLLAALFWIVLLFATLTSMSHAFVREIEGRTMLLLRLVASPTEIATGKLFFNLLFLLVVEAVTVPLFMILTSAPPVNWGTFAGNRYYTFTRSDVVVRERTMAATTDMFTLAQWQAASGQDADATTFTLPWTPSAGHDMEFYDNPYPTARTVAFTGSRTTLEGATVSSPQVVEPYTVLILLP